MKKILFITLFIFGLSSAYSKDKTEHKGHSHKEESSHDSLDRGELKDHEDHLKTEKHADHDDHEDHSDDEAHGGHGDHDDHEGHGGGKAIGENKAITEVDEKKGFKLSPEAIVTLQLKMKLIAKKQFSINKTSLIISKGEKGIYILRDGFFKMYGVQILKEAKDEYIVKVDDVKVGDKLVIQGVGLLRVSDIYSTDLSEYGHSH